MRLPRNSGFTLMELLIATTLISVAMTGIYGLLYSTMSSSRQLDRPFSVQQESRLALTLLQRDIESASIRAEHLFEGDRDGLTLFTVTEPMNVEEGAGARLMRVRYRYRRAQHELVREEAMVQAALPNRPPADKKVKPEHIELSERKQFVVARNIEDFEIRYLWVPLPEHTDVKQPPPPVEPVVVERHKENWGLPTGVEVVLTLSDPETEAEQEFRLVVSMPVRGERLPRKALDDKLGSAS